MARVLEVDAVCVWTGSRGADGDVAHNNSGGLFECKMHLLAVLNDNVLHRDVGTSIENYRLQTEFMHHITQMRSSLVPKIRRILPTELEILSISPPKSVF